MNSWTNEEEKLETEPRVMAIHLNGLWQLGMGVYVNVMSANHSAKIILNGKEFAVPRGSFTDLHDYAQDDAQNFVISKNIQSLPPAKKKRLPPVPRQGGVMPMFQRIQAIFNHQNEGQAEVVEIPNPPEPPINPLAG